MTACKKCILDSRIPDLTVDSEGVCNLCHLHDNFEKLYPFDKKGGTQLSKLVKLMKRTGRSKRYDCVVGVSGGCDSSFLLAKTVEWGLRPLAVHWNNGWNTETAHTNIRRMVKGLGVDYYEYGVAKQEYDDICRSFLLASVPDADIPNDIALTSVLYYTCDKFKVPFMLNGHNFRTEGICPLSWSYMDGKYVASVQAKHGTVPLKTYPNLWLKQWLKWMTEDKIRRLRPLYYLDYRKEGAKRFLHDRFGWRWYGGHHCENKYTIFVGNYLQPRKFGIDLRLVEFAALVRSGHISRKKALKEINKPPSIDKSIIEEVKERLQLSNEDFEKIMGAPKKTHNDYETYQTQFRQKKALFTRLFNNGMIPATFYNKYILQI